MGYAGVKDPRKAYGRRMAREAAREGKREGIEAVAREKLARHRLRHPELHEALRAPRHVHLDEHGRSPRRHEPRSALEKALARGKKLKRQGLQVAQGVHDGLQKVHGTVEKGLRYAGHLEGGLEKAAASGIPTTAGPAWSPLRSRDGACLSDYGRRANQFARKCCRAFRQTRLDC